MSKLDEIIKGRRSIRKYKSDKLDKKVIEQVIDAGVWAPSGNNVQPIRFVVIDGEKSKDKMKKLHDASVEGTEKVLGFKPKMPDIWYGAPYVIFVFVEHKHKETPPMNLLDVGLCVMNMELKAFELGLGTVTCGLSMFSMAKVHEILGTTEKLKGWVPVLGIPLGKPDETPTKERKEAIIEYV